MNFWALEQPKYGPKGEIGRPAPWRRLRTPTTQPAKTTLFAGVNEADVRKSAAGDFFQ
jgi:hypothetical protein